MPERDADEGNSERRGDTMKRRRFVFGALAAGAASALAGCPLQGSDGTDTRRPAGDPAAGTAADSGDEPGPTERGGDGADSDSPNVGAGERVLPTVPEPAEPLDAISPTRLDSKEDMLLTTLQGIVNRKRPRIYVPRLGPDGERLWSDAVDLDVEYHEDAWTIVDTYADETEGVVVYDPDLGTTVNAATTVAGIDDVVAAHPSQVDRLREEYDLAVVRDFRGTFETANEVYRWMIDELLEDATDRVIASLPPANSQTGDQTATDPAEEFPYYTELAHQDGSFDEVGTSTDTLELALTDEVDVADDAIYLRFDDLFPEDGLGARLLSVMVETGSGETVAEFTPGTDAEATYLYDDNSTGSSGDNRFADGRGYWVYEFTVPDGADGLVATVRIENEYLVTASGEAPPRPRYDGDDPRGTARDYAVATEAMTVWLDSGDPVQADLLDEVLGTLNVATACWGYVPDEVGGVSQLSANEVFLGPADFFRSGTVWSGLGTGDGEGVRSARPERADPPELEDRVYVTFTASEGDNLQYCQNALKAHWEDDARGEVPINWSISPLLRDVAPRYLEYFYETATDSDHFMCGPSGIGYAYPRDWPVKTFPTFAALTGAYLDELGIETLYALNRLGIDSTLSPTAIAAYEAETDLLGIAIGWDGPSTRVTGDGVVLSSGINGLGGPKDPAGITSTIREAVPDGWDGDRPVFLSVGVFGFEVSPSDIRAVGGNLDDRFEVVRGDVFFQLAREAMAG